MINLRKKKNPAQEQEVKVLESQLAEAETTKDNPPSAEPGRKSSYKYEKQTKVINSLVGNLSHALDKDDSEIDEILGGEAKPKPDSSPAESKTESGTQVREYYDREKKPAKYRFFLVLGLIVFWLAIIGTFSVVETLREFIFDINNQTELKDEFAKFVFPVVMNDPPEFNEIIPLQSTTVIASAVWQIILTGDTTNYERDVGNMVIPESDVEAAARNLFGFGFDINHRSIDYIVIYFEYNVDRKSYIVPENPMHFTYSPHISEITREGDVFRVAVDYIAPSPQSIANPEHVNEPVKTMIYTIVRTDDAKAIRSIEFKREQEEQDGRDVHEDFYY